jgi:hypothetical protein
MIFRAWQIVRRIGLVVVVLLGLAPCEKEVAGGRRPRRRRMSGTIGDRLVGLFDGAGIRDMVTDDLTLLYS